MIKALSHTPYIVCLLEHAFVDDSLAIIASLDIGCHLVVRLHVSLHPHEQVVAFQLVGQVLVHLACNQVINLGRWGERVSSSCGSTPLHFSLLTFWPYSSSSAMSMIVLWPWRTRGGPLAAFFVPARARRGELEESVSSMWSPKLNSVQREGWM